MSRAEVNQYFFIFGAIVVALFLIAAIASLDRLFDFTEPKRIVTLDSLEILLESIDAQQGTYISGYVVVDEPVTFTDSSSGRELSIQEGPTRQLVLREQVSPSEFVIENTARIDARVDSEAISFSAVSEPDCDVEPITIEDLLERSDFDIHAKRPAALANPKTIVALTSNVEAYCTVSGIENVQVFLTDRVDWFTDKEVFIVVA